MVSNGADGVRRLPDESFASHSRRPNPSRDEHVAFPDDGHGFGTSAPTPPAGLPPSAWAPAPGETPQPWPTLYHRRGLWRLVPEYPGTRRRRARPWVAVLVLGGMLYSGAIQQSAMDSSGGYGLEISSVGANGPTIRDVVDVPFDRAAVILPTDQTTSPLPASPGTIRVEVVSDDPEGSITIATATDTVEINAPYPYAAELALLEAPDRLSVSTRSGSGEGAIQCRVYADGFLVAIGTGAGSATCVAKPSG